jgi:hypothetical protein
MSAVEVGNVEAVRRLVEADAEMGAKDKVG